MSDHDKQQADEKLCRDVAEKCLEADRTNPMMERWLGQFYHGYRADAFMVDEHQECDSLMQFIPTMAEYERIWPKVVAGMQKAIDTLSDSSQSVRLPARGWHDALVRACDAGTDVVVGTEEQKTVVEEWVRRLKGAVVVRVEAAEYSDGQAKE